LPSFYLPYGVGFVSGKTKYRILTGFTAETYNRTIVQKNQHPWVSRTLLIVICIGHFAFLLVYLLYFQAAATISKPFFRLYMYLPPVSVTIVSISSLIATGLYPKERISIWVIFIFNVPRDYANASKVVLTVQSSCLAGRVAYNLKYVKERERKAIVADDYFCENTESRTTRNSQARSGRQSNGDESGGKSQHDCRDTKLTSLL
jgi:hypothetical protein